MFHVVCNQQGRAYWTASSQWYLQQLQNKVILVIQGAGYVNTTFLQQDGTCPYTANVVLESCMTCCRWSWPPCSLDMNPCEYFLKDHVYHTDHICFLELQAVAEDITGHMLWYSWQLCDLFTVSPWGQRTSYWTCSHKHHMNTNSSWN